MHEIRCPNCGQVFTVDESGYAAIAEQVREQEFAKELERREAAIKDAGDKAREIELMRRQQEYDAALAALENEKTQALAKLENEKTEALAALENEKTLALAESRETLAARESEIERLKSELKSGETARELAVAEAERAKDQAYAELERTKDQALAALENEKTQALAEAERAKDAALAATREELIKLQASLASRDQEAELKEKSIREQYEAQIKFKDEEIERYKDFRARQSTKMVGESLEQHCRDEFNKIRMTAFPSAYFEKDNDASSGSKGDFIYREETDGVELISIMFEMKNEMDTTQTKHKNEDFFRELDRDRREKNCEYAVLVSLLEAESELYNAGIVDVSYRYPKMYVVRPQCFIPIITLLRNAALRSLAARRELEIVRNQEVDLTHFEANIAAFKNAFNYNYEQASKRFDEAIKEIDKSIAALQKTKENLLRSDNQLRLASQKVEEQLTVKRLTKGAPTIRAKLDALREE